MSGFLAFLQKNNDARRIFGKRELKIIEKQLLGIDLSQSEKNRLSRDVRRKFEFIKQVARFADEFRLKKGSLVRERVAEALEAIRRDKLSGRLKRVWLFGSTVEKSRTFSSDIDLAVQFNDVTRREATEFRIRILGALAEGTDVQVFETLPNDIQTEISKNGKILYEKQANPQQGR